MPGPKPPQIVLSEDERVELQQLVRAHTSGQAPVRRARVVLLAALGYSNMDIAHLVPMDEEAVGLWRRRRAKWSAMPLAVLSVADRLAYAATRRSATSSDDDTALGEHATAQFARELLRGVVTNAKFRNTYHVWACIEPAAG